MNNTQRPTKIPFGQLIQVSHQVKGLGMGSFDRSADYGSSGKLKAVMQLASKDYLILGPSFEQGSKSTFSQVFSKELQGIGCDADTQTFDPR